MVVPYSGEIFVSINFRDSPSIMPGKKIHDIKFHDKVMTHDHTSYNFARVHTNSEMATTRELSMQFSVDEMVRRYHAHESVWEAVFGEELGCQRERTNSEDPFAVAVMKGETIVGHVPRKISAVCTIFIQRGGSILSRVTGSRCYSEDLL